MVFAKSEKPPEFPNKILENKVSIKHNLGAVWQLIKQILILHSLEEAILIVFPLEVHEVSDYILLLNVELIARIELCQ